MQILALSSWWPEPADNGSRLRTLNLLRGLCAHHDVHLVCLAQGPVATLQHAELDRLCVSVTAVQEHGHVVRRRDVVASLVLPEPASVRISHSSEFAAVVKRQAAIVRPDIVIAFELKVAPYALGISGVPRVLEGLEVSYLLQHVRELPVGPRRLRAQLTWQKHCAYVRQLLAGFDACSVASDLEKGRVCRLAPADLRVAVVPNGVDVRACEGSWGEPNSDTLIYPGALSFEANFDAVQHFLTSIYPHVSAERPETRLLITGRQDPERQRDLQAGPGVVFTGYVPDVRPVVAQAWAEVVPLRKGGGTRLKILEALALGTPVVTTTKGAEGLDLPPGTLLVADEPAAFADATVRLLGSPELRAALATAGRSAVRSRYDWVDIRLQLLALVEEMANTPRLAGAERASLRRSRRQRA